MTESFEDRITLGTAHWIALVKADDAAATVQIGLTSNPDELTPSRSICFSDVTKFWSIWVCPDEGCMESILGAEEAFDGQQYRYMIHTEQRELFIQTKSRAVIPGPDR